MIRPGCTAARILSVAAVLVGSLGPATAQTARMEPAPDDLEGVGVTEHLDAQLPLDLEFRDESGESVPLGKYFDGEKPVILNLVYYRCPMLCGLVLDGVCGGLEELDWSVGDQFEMVTISIDPVETHKLATLKKQNYMKLYGRPGAASGWHFLTGDEDSIRTLADAVGFGFRYVPNRNEFAHSAVTFILTPDGRVSRYLYGVLYDSRTLRMSLLEASQGKIGTVVDRVLMYCYQYDADEGKYSLVARNIMKLGGLVTVVVLAIVLVVFWRREMRRRHEHPALKGMES